MSVCPLPRACNSTTEHIRMLSRILLAEKKTKTNSFGNDAHTNKFDIVYAYNIVPTGAALLENNEASAKLITANGGTFT